MRILYQLHSIWKYAPWTTSQGPVDVFLRSFRVQSTPNLQGVFSILVGASHGSVAVFYAGWWCNNHLEKYEFVNGKDYIPYIMENKTCLKSPLSMEFTWKKTIDNIR